MPNPRTWEMRKKDITVLKQCLKKLKYNTGRVENTDDDPFRMCKSSTTDISLLILRTAFHCHNTLFIDS